MRVMYHTLYYHFQSPYGKQTNLKITGNPPPPPEGLRVFLFEIGHAQSLSNPRYREFFFALSRFSQSSRSPGKTGKGTRNPLSRSERAILGGGGGVSCTLFCPKSKKRPKMDQLKLSQKSGCKQSKILKNLPRLPHDLKYSNINIRSSKNYKKWFGTSFSTIVFLLFFSHFCSFLVPQTPFFLGHLVDLGRFKKFSRISIFFQIF